MNVAIATRQAYNRSATDDEGKPLQRLATKIIAALPELSPKLALAARYVLDRPEEVAISSMRMIATRVGVASPTMLRLARALGYDSYDAFRAVFQNAYVGGCFKIRAELLQENQERGGTAAIAAQISSAAIENIERFLTDIDVAVLARTADAIHRADRVYVLGFGVFQWVASYFQNTGRIALPNLVVPNPAGGVPMEELAGTGPQDVILAMSVSPYAVQTIEAARFAYEKKATVIAITDSMASPLIDCSSQHILVATRSPQYFPSIIAMTAAVETIMAVVVSRSGDTMLARIAAFEDVRRRSGAYF